MVLQPGATSSLDLEKRDRKMAKVLIDIVGLEPEKYRLGYTKVIDERGRCLVNGASQPDGVRPDSLSRAMISLIASYSADVFWALKPPSFPLLPLSTLGHFHFSLSPLISS